MLLTRLTVEKSLQRSASADNETLKWASFGKPGAIDLPSGGPKLVDDVQPVCASLCPFRKPSRRIQGLCEAGYKLCSVALGGYSSLRYRPLPPGPYVMQLNLLCCKLLIIGIVSTPIMSLNTPIVATKALQSSAPDSRSIRTLSPHH